MNKEIRVKIEIGDSLHGDDWTSIAGVYNSHDVKWDSTHLYGPRAAISYGSKPVKVVDWTENTGTHRKTIILHHNGASNIIGAYLTLQHAQKALTDSGVGLLERYIFDSDTKVSLLKFEGDSVQA